MNAGTAAIPNPATAAVMTASPLFAFNGVKAHYQDTRAGVHGEVVIDASKPWRRKRSVLPRGKEEAGDRPGQPNPDNVKVLRHTYVSRSNAEGAARAEWQKIQRGVATFNITLARGRAELFPSLHAKVSGWKPQIDGTGWSVGRVVHSLNDSGFTTALELEIAPARLKEVGTAGTTP